MGNGNEASGDGFKYRAGGYIGITGKTNYLLLSKDTRIDFVNNPDLLLQEANAIVAAHWFWNKNHLNLLADKDNVRAITKVVNGGYNGLAHRTELLKTYKNEFKIS